MAEGGSDAGLGLDARLNLDLSALRDGVRDAAKQGGAIGGALGGAIGTALGGVLEGAAGKVADLFGEALGREAAGDKLAAQLGLSPEDQARAGKIAADAFAGNYGDSFEQVNDSVKSVVQNIGTSLSDANFSGINAKVLDLSSTFDQDLGGVTKAVGQLIKTGLAKDATEGLDIVTRGFQTGADKADDFLDTLNEYGTQFRKLGIDGATATGIINQGLQAGARDGDLVADALKEFSIRAIDGSDSTKAAYKGLGLSADDFTKKIAAGGPAANEALSVVLDRLRAVKDPAKQAALATGLFGTQAEDLGKSLLAINPRTAVAGLGQVAGAADKLDKQIAGNSRASLSAFTRQLSTSVVTALEVGVIPALTGVTGALSSGLGPVLSAVTPVLSNVGSVLSTVAGAFQAVGNAVPSPILQGLAIVLGVITGLLVAQAAASAAAAAAQTAAAAVTALFTTAVNLETGATERGLVARTAHNVATVASRGIALAGAAATTVMTGAQAALNAVMAANPIVLVVTAIALLVAAFVVAYKKSETFRDIVKGAMHIAAEAIHAPVDAAQEAAHLIAVAFDGVVGFIGDIPGRISGAVSGMFDGVTSGFKAAINFIIDALNHLKIKVPKVHIPLGPTLGGQEFGFSIPRLADGGVVRATSGGTPAIVGEGNYDELVQPLRPGVDTFGTDAIVTAVEGLRDEVRKQNDRAFTLKRQGATP